MNNKHNQKDLNFYYYKIWILFICIGLVSSLYMLLFEDFHTALFYFFGITFYMVLMYFSMAKNSSIFLKIFSSTIFFGYFVSIPIIYYEKEIYTTSGWTTIGKFDFSFKMFSEAYLFILLVFSAVIIISLLIERVLFYNSSYRINKHIFFQQKFNISIRSKTIFIVMILAEFVLSHFMLQHKIGITGINPDFLPYRLAGIMYYYRLFVIPIVSFVLLLTEKKPFKGFLLAFLIAIEAIYSGLVSTSRLLFLLHFAPVLYFASVSLKSKKILIFLIILFFITFAYLTFSRNYLYSLSDFSSISIFDILSYFIEKDFNPVANILDAINTIVLRNLGFREFVVTYYSDYSYVDGWLFIRDFWGINNLVNISFDANDKIFELYVPGYSIGSMALDPLSIFYLSSTNVPMLIFFFLFSILVVLILERYLMALLSSTNNLITLAILHMTMLMFIFHPGIKNNLYFLVFLLTLFIIIMHILPKKKTT